jgi:uncharacterized protein
MSVKTVLITGASTGIGYELGKIYSKQGYNLVLVARNEKKLQEVAEEYKAQSGAKSVLLFPLDLSIPGSAQTLFDFTVKEKLDIDILINNAGFGSNGEFWKLPLDNEVGMIRLNIESLVHLCYLFIKPMITKKQGMILNVGSTAGFQPGPYMSNYYATKAYVLHFTEGLAEEAKPYNVQISVLCPGPTITDFFQRAGMSNTDLLKSALIPKMSAKEVAEYGFQQFHKGKLIIVPGWINKLTPISSRFSPRFLVRKLAGLLNHSKT